MTVRSIPPEFAEVVVNVPIRRTFAQRSEPPPADGDGDEPAVAQHQLFHYSVPPELQHLLEPGHLVWAPFGRQIVLGIVVALSDSAPVQTRPLDRLARPEPVLSPVHYELARWIAESYVAPLSEAIKLFLPPGMLTRKESAGGLQTKRELQVELAIEPRLLPEALLRAGRETQQSRVLAWMLQHPQQSLPVKQLQNVIGLKSPSAIHSLCEKQILQQRDGMLSLMLPPAEARQALLALRGADRLVPVLEVLAGANGPLWKSDLYQMAKTDLKSLRALQAAGLIRLEEKIRFRDPLAGRVYQRTVAPLLTDEQAAVWQVISDTGFAQTQINGQAYLLHGVTGSGKTEIYLRALAETLARGRQAIVLVPEIALTPQTVARFAGRFPGRVTVIHSGMNAGERYDVWRHVRDGEFDIVVGPRSALFAPLARLGLLILDEEHEASYKQNAEEWGSFTVFYDARRVALRLSELTESNVIFGSATPSLQSYYAAQQGRFRLLHMARRVIGHGVQTVQDGQEAAPVAYGEMPPVEVVDMRQELRAGNRSIFSRSLQAELHATLDANQQAILFLNRRGSATFVMCRDCGHVEECPRCEAPLTYHERAAQLICHHCNRRYPVPIVCPQCEQTRIKYFGSGTQRIEEFVQQIAPRARLLRWDADTTGRKGSHEEILARFAGHEADVLVGTQMIAKGLDLPKVTLVGVIAADVGLFLPDFRSGERTFQLLTQVAGRAGRSVRGGRVVIQSYRPDHYAIQAAAHHDFDAFYTRELDFRREHGYPPVRRLARLIYWNRNREKAEEEAIRMGAALRARIGTLGVAASGFNVMGPAPAFFRRFRGYYRWQILLRAAQPAELLRSIPMPFGWRIDIDPVSTL